MLKSIRRLSDQIVYLLKSLKFSNENTIFKSYLNNSYSFQPLVEHVSSIQNNIHMQDSYPNTMTVYDSIFLFGVPKSKVYIDYLYLL